MSTAVIHKADFQTQVLDASLPVLVDFFATWCGPCRMLAPILDEAEESYAGKVAFYKVDIDQDPDLAARYGVMSVPTLMLFKNGEPANTSVGLISSDELDEFLS